MKLCILAAGLGNRMGAYTKSVPKCMLPLGPKPILSYIIEKVAPTVPIVIAVGYKGDLIVQFCEAAYPDREFTFVRSTVYNTPEGGPAIDLYSCMQYLQEPFYLSTSDDVFIGPLPSLDYNWISVQPTDLPEVYSTADLNTSNDVLGFKDKSASGYQYAFTGIAGISEYKIFWKQIEKVGLKTKEFVSAWLDPSRYTSLKGEKLEWLNVGLIDTYLSARKSFQNICMPKVTGNQTYIVNDRVVKLFTSSEDVYRRIIRSKNLPNMPSNIRHDAPYVYSYDMAPGVNLYQKPEMIPRFIKWCFDNLFHMRSTSDIDPALAYDFYRHKTFNRITDFLAGKDPCYYDKCVINGVEVDSIFNQMHGIDWSMFANTVPTPLWHGDLQLENVIVDDDGKFTLIDWRDSFAGSDIGDIYYDLGKLYGSLILPYYSLREAKNYHIYKDGNDIELVTPQAMDITTFLCHVYQSCFKMPKIALIAALIQLNMAPLHEYPLNDFLYYFSRLTLQRELNG